MAHEVGDRDNNAAMSSMDLEGLLSMKGGKGEASYANNSQSQAIHARAVLHLLKETLDTLKLYDNPNIPFTVADLGCSSGNNTINTVGDIIKHIIKRYHDSGFVPPEFSAFFSDLPSNDFNSLFQLLPPLLNNNYGGSIGREENHRQYFVASVPGSFYRRLFPARSINFFHSAFSLHWISQIPESVMDKKAREYNKGRVSIHGASESTANAYKRQFQTDLANYLKCRSLEIKKGGSMFLLFLGRTSPDPTDQGGPGLLFGTHFQGAWNDLVQEGLISSEKRDNFNIPLYASSLQDLREVVEADGSFVINRLELFKGGSPLVVSRHDDDAEVGRALANTCKTLSSVLVDAHIGETLSNELFSRVGSRATSHGKQLLDQIQFYDIVASLSLA